MTDQERCPVKFLEPWQQCVLRRRHHTLWHQADDGITWAAMTPDDEPFVEATMKWLERLGEA